MANMEKSRLSSPKELRTPVYVPRPSTGAASELIVAADLLRRGFEVFRAVSAACSCDLIASRQNALFRVEVKTGSISSNGKICYAPTEHNIYDILAIVVDTQVIYEPDVNSLSWTQEN